MSARANRSGDEATTGAPLGQLRLLATTDVHVNLQSFDYYTDSRNAHLGLTRTATLIAQARQEAPDKAVVLLDNGDWLQGTPLGESAIANPQFKHPVMRAFEYLNYDAVGLGNHEFNFGLEALNHVLGQAPCPVVCSNLDLGETAPQLPLLPHVVLERRVSNDTTLPAARIGVFSVVPPQSLKWDSKHLTGHVTFRDMVEASQAAIATLKDQGCDVIVALAHTGLGADSRVPLMENALRPIAHLPGLDALVGGHTHLLLPDPEGNTPALPVPTVMPGTAGSHLGVIDLDLRFVDGKWQTHSGQAALRPICPGADAPVQEDNGLATLLEADHQRTRAAMAEPVGETDHSLHSYFTFCAADRALALAAEAQAAAVRAALVGTPWENLPLLSAAAPAKFGGRAGPRSYTEVPEGPLSLRHVADLYMYPNELRCIILNGQALRDWLEMSASFFAQAVSGGPAQPLGDYQRAGHNFDSLFGVSYEIDITAPARFDSEGMPIDADKGGPGRIRDLRHLGRPVTDDMLFAVALNSYRADGGGNFAMLQQGTHVSMPPLLVREAIQAYIQGALPRDPLADCPYPWRFAPDMGVTAIALTGPGALPYLDELPRHVRLQEDLSPRGFMALELDL